MRGALPAWHQVALAAVSAAVVTLLWAAGALAPFDLPAGDFLLRLPWPAAGASARAPVAAVLVDDAAVEALGPLPWPRARLAHLVDAAFGRGARAVVVDLILSEPGDPAGDRALEAALSRGPAVLAAALRPDGGWLLPLERFGGGARAAHVEAELGPDGVVRGLLATKQRGDLALPAMALAAARTLRPALPITPGRRLRPDFRLPPEAVPQVGAAAFLEGTAGPLDLEGRIVFLGISAAGAGDQFVVPTSRRRPAPGVLIHAAATASILGGGLLRPLGTPGVLLACLAAAALAQVLRSRGGRLRVALLLGAGLLLLPLSLLSLRGGGVQLPAVTLAAALGLSALLREGLESRWAQRQTGLLLGRLVAESAPAGGTASGPEPDPTGAAQAAGAADSPARPPGLELSTPPRGAAGRLELARQLQDRLIRDRNLRRTLLDALEDGVVHWDAAGEPLLANAAARRLLGEPPPRRQEVEGLETLRRDGEGPCELTLRRGGREIKVVVQPLAEDDPARRVSERGELALFRDVTAERELESRRREMQRLVSHELKTPLASIAGFGGMLERYELSPEELQRVAGMVRGESERLLAMVTTFLDLERLGSGRLPAEKAPLELGELAAERREVLAAAAAEGRQHLELVRRGPAPVVGDGQLLARVVDNLVGNALKYSPEESTVTLEVGTDGPWATLRVRDEGPGIPPEALPRLFDRFYRVPGAGSSGAGLGLALVREISEWHGGCVDVESATGAGSTFRVRLPLEDGRDGDEPR